MKLDSNILLEVTGGCVAWLDKAVTVGGMVFWMVSKAAYLKKIAGKISWFFCHTLIFMISRPVKGIFRG